LVYAAQPRSEIGETAAFLDGFHRLELPVLDADGQSRWPERFTPERLAQIRRRSGPARFAAQMLLQPTSSEDGRLDPERIALYGEDIAVEHLSGDALRLSIGKRRLVSASCWWDPSFGSPRKGDGSVVAVVFTDEEGTYRLHRIRWLTHTARDPADAATQMCRQVADFAAEHHVPAVRLESNGLGKFLPGLLRRVIAEQGGSAGVIECTSRKAKAVRILEAFDAVLAAGALQAHHSVAQTSFFQEMRDWRPGVNAARDDGLDAVAGCLASEPVRLGQFIAPATRRDWRGGLAPQRAVTDFDL
jgi:predicted phage terminase large subunit-like protein